MSLIDVPYQYYHFPLISLNLYNYSGEAEAILAKARATAEGLALVSQSLKENGGAEVSFLIFFIFHILHLVRAVNYISLIDCWLLIVICSICYFFVHIILVIF